MEPLVTIVTITFNLIKAGREHTFRQCVESIHNQTYKNIEHIIIDGASSDGTIDLLEEYTQKGWIKYYSEPDTGIYNAFNKGIDKANGEYIAFVNSDDYYHSTRGVEESIKALLNHNADYSYADDYLLDEPKPHKSKIRKARIHRIFHRMPFCHQTMFCKKSTLLEIGKFDETFKSAGDYDLVMRLFLSKKYKGVFVPHVFCTFRMGGESNLNEETSQEECVQIFQKHYSQFYSLTRLDAIIMFCNIKTPIKLLSKLFEYFSFKQKILFLLFYITKLILHYRRQLIQLRIHLKPNRGGVCAEADNRLRLFNFYFIPPKPEHCRFKQFQKDGYLE